MADKRNKFDKHLLPYLYDYVKKKVDLAEFLETQINCNLRWYEQGVSAGTICPLPHHKDIAPSFRIKYIEEDGLWIFNCFGCGAKGTIIDFCMEYYGLNSSAESVLFICDKFGFKGNVSLITDSLKDVKKKINLQRKIECAHIISANQCRTLLRKDYDKYKKWVADAYKKMNFALDNKEIDVVEEIGFEASGKIGE